MRIRPFFLYATQIAHRGLRTNSLFGLEKFALSNIAQNSQVMYSHNIAPENVTPTTGNDTPELEKMHHGNASTAATKPKKAKKRQQFAPYVIHEEDITEKFARGGGPGGQCVNKSMNKVTKDFECDFFFCISNCLLL